MNGVGMKKSTEYCVHPVMFNKPLKFLPPRVPMVKVRVGAKRSAI